jgi:predicted nucleotidyltransferase
LSESPSPWYRSSVRRLRSEVTYLDRDGVIRDLARAAGSLVDRETAVKEVRLFGSLATGKHAPGSDADILIVLRDDPRPSLERVSHYLPLLQTRSIPVEVFPYTQAEIERMVATGNAFLKLALEESLPLA